MSFSIPTWLKQDDDLMLGDRPGSSDWFALSDEVGRGRTNHRRDVIKVESLLNQAGLFDLERLDGPWGYANERLDAPIKEYQKRNGLKVDGFLRPDGETINRFRQDYGDTFANFPAPTPTMADAHHALRDQGEDGLLIDRWPELKVNPHPRLDPLAAKAGFDEWNESWAKHAASANGSFDGIPAELKKYVDQDPVRGIMQARDMTQRWEALRPGEGNKFARAMLQALDGKPDYQSAYLAGEVPQGPPIGTPRADAAQRYAAMVEEGRAERATDAQQVAQVPQTAPTEKSAEVAKTQRPIEELPDDELEVQFQNTSLNAKDSARSAKRLSDELKEANKATQAKWAELTGGMLGAAVEGAAEGATEKVVKETIKDAILRRSTTALTTAARAVRGSWPGAASELIGYISEQAAEVLDLEKKEQEIADVLKYQQGELDKWNARQAALLSEKDRRRGISKSP